jgi:hypothetical protein
MFYVLQQFEKHQKKALFFQFNFYLIYDLKGKIQSIKIGVISCCLKKNIYINKTDQ